MQLQYYWFSIMMHLMGRFLLHCVHTITWIYVVVAFTIADVHGTYRRTEYMVWFLIAELESMGIFRLQSVYNKQQGEYLIAVVYFRPFYYSAFIRGHFLLQCIVWDVAHGQPLNVISCHSNTIYSISWNHDGSLFATSCKDKKIRVVDPRTGCVLQVSYRRNDCVTVNFCKNWLWFGTWWCEHR